MLVLVTYDVGRRHRQAPSAAPGCARLSGFGTRVQLSVFECEVDPAQWTVLRARLLDLIDPQADSLRFYQLGSGVKRIEHIGAKRPLDPDGALIL